MFLIHFVKSKALVRRNRTSGALRCVRLNQHFKPSATSYQQQIVLPFWVASGKLRFVEIPLSMLVVKIINRWMGIGDSNGVQIPKSRRNQYLLQRRIHIAIQLQVYLYTPPTNGTGGNRLRYPEIGKPKQQTMFRSIPTSNTLSSQSILPSRQRKRIQLGVMSHLSQSLLHGPIERFFFDSKVRFVLYVLCYLNIFARCAVCLPCLVER